MKSVAIIAAVVATSAFAVSPASSNMSMCSGDHLSKMTTMSSGMPDGPHKWEMYKHLEMVNTAMAKDGIRGCERTMMKMHRHHKHHMHHMKHGKQM